MARPRKRGLEYFPMDVDFFEDYKIKILKSRFGADGMVLYMYLLCQVYKEGYYITINDDFYFITADELKMSKEKVMQVINFLLERSLFDKTLFQSDKVLTSAGIQRRFQQAVKERAKKTPIDIKRFWILSDEETESFMKVNPSASYSNNNGNYSGNNLDNSSNYTTKERKENKSNLYNPRNKFNQFPQRNYSPSQIEEIENRLLNRA